MSVAAVDRVPAAVRTSEQRPPLRVAAVGSVDDGKSTLLGRLLHDSTSIFEDQLAEITDVSRRRGSDRVDLALLTDGLRAERQQGITIDVAWRYFSTPRRSFVVADCPGHVQYTRNAITGASTADVAVVLVDVRHGIVDQTRRHTALLGLLRVPHVVVAVNKMDLVGHGPDRFVAIERDVATLAAGAGISSVACIPVSALEGDNVVERSASTPWYGGPTLLGHLEALDASAATAGGLRFPVQTVIRAPTARHPGGRWVAGTVAAGGSCVGDDVVVWPSGRRARIAAIETADGPLDRAVAGRAVVLGLTDGVDVARGDLLASPDDPPLVTCGMSADVAWLDADADLVVGRPYALKLATRTVRAAVTHVEHRVDVDTFSPRPASGLAANDIGRVSLRTEEPVVADDYGARRATGSFILIDEATDQTSAAGMVRIEP